jgi:Ca2+-binding RTX toxin-like protein
MSYDLNQTQLSALLNNSVSSQTQNLINTALMDSGYYPTRGLLIPAAAVDDSSPSHSPVTANLNLGVGNAEFGESIALYVETGSNVTVNVDTASPYGSVIAAGDGDSVSLNDVAGWDTLVGGAGLDTLTGGLGSYLMAGSGANVLNDSVGDDTLVGGTGQDTMNVSGADDTIYGGSGPETINMSGSGSALYAGTGFESITLAASSHDTIYLGQGSSQPATDSVVALGGADSVYVGSAGGVDTINAESIASGDTLNLYISGLKGSTQVVETDPSTNTWQISYGSGSSTTSITVEGSNVVLHFNNGASGPGGGTHNI